MIYEAFFIKGFQFRGIWQENTIPTGNRDVGERWLYTPSGGGDRIGKRRLRFYTHRPNHLAGLTWPLSYFLRQRVFNSPVSTKLLE
jgi:hypothetical protein